MWLSEGGGPGHRCWDPNTKATLVQALGLGLRECTPRHWWSFMQKGTHSFGQRVCSRSVLFFVFFIQCNGFEVHLSY